MIRIPYSIWFSIVCIFMAFFSCKNEDEKLTDYQLGYHFYPISIGKSIVYKTDTIMYQKTFGINGDTSTSYIKETVVDSFRDQVGQLVYNVEISYRNNDSLPWDLIDNTFITVTANNILRNDFGFDFIKLVFPVTKNKSWNGNIYLDPETELKFNGEFFKPFSYWNGKSYYYKEISDNQKIGDISYTQTLTVEESDYSEPYNKIYSTVIYALDVGMVYREFWLLNSQNSDLSIPWPNRAEYGAIIKQTRIQ
ncbi:MAG: hypothetical protein ABI851_11035 [Saprospiraceae bacterium]